MNVIIVPYLYFIVTFVKNKSINLLIIQISLMNRNSGKTDKPMSTITVLTEFFCVYRVYSNL